MAAIATADVGAGAKQSTENEAGGDGADVCPTGSTVSGEGEMTGPLGTVMTRELAKIADMLAGQNKKMDAQDKKMNARMDAQDRKMDEQDRKMDAMAAAQENLGKELGRRLDDIQKAAGAMEAKLTRLSSRQDVAEERLVALEHFQREVVEAPTAGEAEIRFLMGKIDDMENRDRRLNLKFVGFPEKIEKEDALGFIKDAIKRMWPGIVFPNGLEIERAHRLGTVRTQVEGQAAPKPRPIIARFLRFQDKESIMAAARRAKGIWDREEISVYPDFSKAVNEKRALFNPCKKLLHQKGRDFALSYPATLVIFGVNGVGRRTFDEHRKAHDYIKSLV